MEIRASIYDPEKTEPAIHKDIKLSQFVTSENVLQVNDVKYLVCQTLFEPNYLNVNTVYVEQILELQEHTGNMGISHCLLCGTIYLNDIETALLFRNIKTNVEDANSPNGFINLNLMYPYMRNMDCVEINDIVHRIYHITVNSEIGATVDFYVRDLTRKMFRENTMRFCRNNRP